MFQVQTISVVYFQYATATDILISLPGLIQIPDFTFCVRYFDVFDLSGFNASENGDIHDTSTNDEHIRELQSQVTIADIFNHTPDVNELWVRCLSRKTHEYDIIHTNGSECKEVFRVRKYYVQEYMCYNFHQIKSENATYSFRNIAFSLAFPGVFYAIFLENNSSLRSAEYCRAVVHSHKGLPTDSLSFSHGFYRKYDKKTQVAKYNNVQVSYYQLFKKLLPFPFQTDCRDYESEDFDSQIDCINDCMNKSTVAAFNKIPFSIFQLDPIELKHINTRDLGNEIFADQFQKIETKCLDQCNQADCDDSYTLSQVSKEEKVNGGGGLSFMVNAPRGPSFLVTHRPLMPLTDYLVYVLSCFGTWFGLSVLSLNPFSWNSNEGRKQKTDGCETKKRGDLCCLETRAELRREMRNDFIHMSRLVAQLKWGSTDLYYKIPNYKYSPISNPISYHHNPVYYRNPDLRSRFRAYPNYVHPTGKVLISK